jgi:hypothetical protein
MPGGEVTFKDGSTVIGTAALQNGVATLSLPGMALGGHTLSAEYAGNDTFATSTAGPYSFPVWKAESATGLTLSSAAVAAGQDVTLTASVGVRAPGAGSATGQVTFYDGSRALGTVPVAAGKAVLKTDGLTAGAHMLRAVYHGDTAVQGSSSAPMQVMARTATQTLVQASPSTHGQHVVLRATVTGLAPGSGNATGRVTFMDGTRALGTANVYHGQASMSVTGLATGAHSISAVYQGAGAFLGSTSAPLAYTVQKAWASMRLATNPAAPAAGQLVGVWARLATPAPGAARPTGKVTFKEGSKVLGTADVRADGWAGVGLRFTKGSHRIYASYAGDADYRPNAAVLNLAVA